MIETPRLKLIALKHQQIKLLKSSPRGLALSLGINYQPKQNDPKTLKDLEEAIVFWLYATKHYPADYQWYTNWEIILKAENVSIGGIGFAGKPDELGESEVGYGIDVRYHNKGFATEALAALMKWGFNNESLKAIKAKTPSDNISSQKVLEKNGFKRVDETAGVIEWLALK